MMLPKKIQVAPTQRESYNRPAMRGRHHLSLILFMLAAVGCDTTPNAQRAAAQAPAVWSATASPQSEAYKIQPGDQISVDFLYNKELSSKQTVRMDGMISMPFIGDVKAAGQLPDALGKKLESSYAGVLRNPNLLVTLAEASGNQIYVGGEVKVPGIYPLPARLTVMRALVSAGGTLETASLARVVVVRDNGTPNPEIRFVSLSKPVKGEMCSADIPLQPRDIVMVPKSAIAEADLFVKQYINDLIPFSKQIGAQYNLGTLSTD